ncbi:MAG: hypothetical protein H7203_01430 [Rhizobacter sp.]|nr:hypothetical protein [Burkholderiales bacterium]
MAVTDALAKTIEDTKSFVDTANEKMNKAKGLLDDNVKLVNQAMQDYQEVKALLEQAKMDVATALKALGDGVKAAGAGNLPALVITVAENVPKIIDAVARYTKVIANLKEKVENYKKAVGKNIDVVKSF